MTNYFIATVFFSVFIVHIQFKLVESHAYFSSITVDGLKYNEGVCIRPHPSSKYDYPISDIDNPSGLQSNDMTCGFLPSAGKAANKKCPVNPGSTIDIQWHYEMGLGSSDTFIIDPSHKGPCIVYLAKSETGAGNVWFKIFEDGYDSSTKKWCVDKLRANKGVFSIKIPTDITPGNYLMRVELIALHEGFELGGAQPYVHCAEITVGGSGTVNPGNLVAFPGAYKANDKGLYFDIYPVKGAYPIPGPPLYVSGSSNPSSDVTTSVQSVTSKSLTTKSNSVTTKAGTSKSLTTKSLTTKSNSVTTKAPGDLTTKSASTTSKVATTDSPAATTRGRRSTSTTGVLTTDTNIDVSDGSEEPTTESGENTSGSITNSYEETSTSETIAIELANSASSLWSMMSTVLILSILLLT